MPLILTGRKNSPGQSLQPVTIITGNNILSPTKPSSESPKSTDSDQDKHTDQPDGESPGQKSE